LSTPTYQTVPVSCPNCGSRFVTPVLTIVDASQNPQTKALFLAGQVNVAVCPQCGHAAMLSAPLVYHDADKELLFTYMPPEIGVSEVEQQRIIGDLTNRVMTSLPAEKRKGYLLRPRSFLRLEAMIEAILEADGITPAMLAQQRAKADLLDRLMRATSEEARKVIAQEDDALIDYEFFQLLSLNIELAEAQGQEEAAQQLLGLRSQLLEWTTLGHEIAAQEEAIASLGTEITREGLLEKLVEAARAGEEAKIEAMVTFARPAIDYIFYQQLTSRIEAAEKAKNRQDAKTLKALRETVLDLTAQIDAEMEKATREAAQFLQELLDSDDPKGVLRANVDRVDELFLDVLTTALDTARRSGKAERAEKLEQISSALMQLIQESQPPEVQFINQLLSADYPEGTQALLEENRQRVDDRLLELMRLIGDDFDQRGRSEAARRMEQIREQATAIAGA
jgi:hypothetical protein